MIGRKSLDGKVVVVTGASAGVGRAAVRSFARLGARIGLLARGVDGLRAAKDEVELIGSEAVVKVVDVSEPDQVERAAEEIETELGPIDVWVNNAMVTVMAEIRDMSPAEYRRVTEVTYLGAVHGTLSALARMLPRGRGKIVQVGSALSYRAIPLQSAYCASKHALRGFTDSLRCELIHQGSKVSVTMVQLPALNTPQFKWSKIRFPRQPRPVPPIYQPEVAAEAIVLAATSSRREIWVGGPSSALMFANKLLPGLGDWYLGLRGYRSQFTDDRVDPDRPNNLFGPLPGDWGVRGPFTDESEEDSQTLQFSRNRRLLSFFGGATAAAIATLLWNSRD